MEQQGLEREKVEINGRGRKRKEEKERNKKIEEKRDKIIIAMTVNQHPVRRAATPKRDSPRDHHLQLLDSPPALQGTAVGELPPGAYL